MQYTTNLELKKPDSTDYVNVNDLNENADILDEKITEITNSASDSIKIKKNITIAAVNWVDDTANSGLFTYNINDVDITANTVVDVNVHLASLDNAESLKSVTESFNGYVRIYADENPTSDIIADLKLIRELVI